MKVVSAGLSRRTKRMLVCVTLLIALHGMLADALAAPRRAGARGSVRYAGGGSVNRQDVRRAQGRSYVRTQTGYNDTRREFARDNQGTREDFRSEIGDTRSSTRQELNDAYQDQDRAAAKNALNDYRADSTDARVDRREELRGNREEFYDNVENDIDAYRQPDVYVYYPGAVYYPRPSSVTVYSSTIVQQAAPQPAAVPAVGATSASLPDQTIAVELNASRYYYHQGTFWIQSTNGYRVVKAPVGISVPYLPPNSEVKVVQGKKTHYFGGTYYRATMVSGVTVYTVVLS